MARVGKRNKTKFILCKELIILILVLIAMIVTTICLAIPSESQKKLEEFNNAITEYNTANNTSFSTLGEDYVFKKASLNDVSSAIDGSKGTDTEPKYAYILYGSLKDATIIEFLSVINKEAQNREVDTVYLYSSDKVENQEDKDDEQFLAELDNDEKVFNVDVLEGVEEIDLLKAPAFYVYKNGELVFNSVSMIEDGSYNWHLVINKAFALQQYSVYEKTEMQNLSFYLIIFHKEGKYDRVNQEKYQENFRGVL